MTHQYEYPEVYPLKRRLFSSLAVRNFRFYISGHFISMTGTWMQVVALSWLVWRLTGSGKWLGAVGFASRITTFLFCLVGGVIADRFFRRNLILVTQILVIIPAAVLAVLTLTGTITPPIIIVLLLFMGAIFAFDYPARQSLITDIVGKEEVDNAIALTSSSVHVAGVAGPALAGLVIARLGEGICFVINAISFLAMIAAILCIRDLKTLPRPTENPPIRTAILEGLKTSWNDANLRMPLILLASLSLFGMPYYTLTPIFIDKIYNAGSKQYGLLMAASALGAVIGAFIMARDLGRAQTIRNMGVGSLGLGLSIVTFSRMETFWMGVAAITTIGLFMLVAIASINAWIQKESPDHVRGRVMSIYTMLFFGFTPFGSLLFGFLAERIGAPTTLTIGGTLCSLAGIWFIIKQANFCH